MPTQGEKLASCLLGMAIGDALGLPCEGLGPRRQKRLFPELTDYRFLGRLGMVSDDTEHACLTAQALLANPQDPEGFGRSLAWKLRWWLLGLPAGIGMATLKACLRLWLGWPHTRSGVNSAGNGPAMRAILLGCALGDRPEQLSQFVRISTRMTHRDPRAEAGSLALALATWLESQGQRESFLEALAGLCPNQPEFQAHMAEVVARRENSQTEFMAWLGCDQGITGYMPHTASAVIWFWLQTDAFQACLLKAIRCGGDTDTVAALLGGIRGAGLSLSELPEPLLANLWLWPQSIEWIQQLATQLAQSLATGVVSLPKVHPFKRLLRNFLFGLVVLLHGFRRLAPPY